MGDESTTLYKVVSVCIYSQDSPAASIYFNRHEALEVYGALSRDSDIRTVTLTSFTLGDQRNEKEISSHVGGGCWKRRIIDVCTLL